jgi:hypothetical protein
LLMAAGCALRPALAQVPPRGRIISTPRQARCCSWLLRRRTCVWATSLAACPSSSSGSSSRTRTSARTSSWAPPAASRGCALAAAAAAAGLHSPGLGCFLCHLLASWRPTCRTACHTQPQLLPPLAAAPSSPCSLPPLHPFIH